MNNCEDIGLEGIAGTEYHSVPTFTRVLLLYFIINHHFINTILFISWLEPD